MAIGTIHVLAPPIVNNTEVVKVRAWHVPTALADMIAFAIDPDGIEFNITGHLRLISTGSFSFVEATIDFNKLGDHTVYIRNTVSSDWGVVQVRSTRWAGNMDAPISDFNKLGTEISRVRTTIKKGA